MLKETLGHAASAVSILAPETAGAFDEELARRFADGDDNAFDEIVRRHRDRVYQFVRWHLGGTRSEAEDVTQDVLLEVYRCRASFEGRSRLTTWILGVARNVCRQARRSRRRCEAISLDAAVADGARMDLPDVRVDLLADLERQEQRSALRFAIEGLSAEQRSALLLRDVEALSYDEIAAVLGIPVGTVRSRLHNARAALGRRLTASSSSVSGEER